ncbi:MAG: hypothetical protein JRI46_00120 [Deltaproteobacteria bacterium]|nr:hypothetical protein [Deltaproteobacteria bacterium]
MEEDRTWGVMRRISPFILFSFFLHLVVLLAVPNLLKPTKVSLIPVTMIKAADLYLEPVQKNVVRGGEEMGLWEDTPVQRIRDELVLRRLSEMGLSEERKPPIPRVSLFPAEKLDEQEKMRILKTSRFYHELEEIMQKEERRGEIYNAPRPMAKNVKGGALPLPEDVEAKRIIASLKEVGSKRAKRPLPLPETVKLGIKGPAASRKVIYIPPPPKVKVSVAADVLLKFWVIPNGTVGKVIPLVKGGATVDLAAIKYIKRYRFNPLPKDVPQVEMWGVISVRSVLR